MKIHYLLIIPVIKKKGLFPILRKLQKNLINSNDQKTNPKQSTTQTVYLHQTPGSTIKEQKPKLTISRWMLANRLLANVSSLEKINVSSAQKHLAPVLFHPWFVLFLCFSDGHIKLRMNCHIFRQQNPFCPLDGFTFAHLLQS